MKDTTCELPVNRVNLQTVYGRGRQNVFTVVLLFLSLSLLCCAPKQHASDTVEVPLYYDVRTSHYYVQAQIGTQVGWMLLDTASGKTVLDISRMEDKNIHRTKTYEKINFPYYNRSLSAEKIYISSVFIGKWKLTNQALFLADLSFLRLPSHIQGQPIFGILGYDLIQKWRYVKISKERIVFSTQANLPLAKSIAFPLRTLTGCSALLDPNSQSFWIFDTGVSANYIKSERSERTASLNSCQEFFESVVLKSYDGSALWFPALKKQQENPLFDTLPPKVRGLIGNALLERFVVVMDHSRAKIHFIPASYSESEGTFGLLLYHDESENKVFGNFIVGPNTGEDFFVLKSVNGRLLSALDDETLNYLSKPSAGTVANFTIVTKRGETKSLERQAFSPKEISVQFYKATIRTSNIRSNKISKQQSIRHTIAYFGGGSVWIYPYQMDRLMKPQFGFARVPDQTEGPTHPRLEGLPSSRLEFVFDIAPL